MANYKSSDVVGSAYIRCSALLIRNPKNSMPTVDFAEEKYYELDIDPIGVPHNPNKPFSVVADMAYEFDILDPTTGEPTGSKIKVSDMYTYLYSYYIDQAIKRDIREAEQAAAAAAAAATAV